MRKKFWRWMFNLSLRKTIDNRGVKGLGIPGVRDPENKCHSFMPGNFEDRGFMHCDGDGHFLCGECRYKNKPENNLS